MQTVMDAYAALGLTLRRKTASEMCGPCPVCGGRDRYTVFVDQGEGRGTWYCRKCERGGDLIEFYRHVEGMGYHDACKAADMPNPTRSAAPRQGRRKPQGLTAAPCTAADRASGEVLCRDAWRIKAGEFMERCAAHLTPDSPAGRWLAARGLPQESWRSYGLGYNPGENGKPCSMRARKAWGLADGAPRNGGQARRALWLPRGIVIPHLSGRQTDRLRIRRNNEDLTGSLAGMKYYVVPGSEMTPLLLPCRGGVLPPDACGVVVEAELDAMAVHHAAGDLALCLASMTAKIRHLPQAVMDALRRCAVILVALDYGDASGAGAEGWNIWRETFPQARRWPVPAGKDPGEAFARGVDLRAWVASGLPPALADMATRRKETAMTAGMDSAPAEADAPDTETPAAAPADLPSLPPRTLADVTAALLSTDMERSERLELLQEFYPLHRLYDPWDASIRFCLEGHGLRLHPRGDDFALSGWERWPGKRLALLMRFLRLNDTLLNNLAHNTVPSREEWRSHADTGRS